MRKHDFEYAQDRMVEGRALAGHAHYLLNDESENKSAEISALVSIAKSLSVLAEVALERMTREDNKQDDGR